MGHQVRSATRRTIRNRGFRLGKPAQLQRLRRRKTVARPGAARRRELAVVLGAGAVPTAPTLVAGAQVGALAIGAGVGK